MNLLNLRQSAKGFTLIELLVVIAIIGILASVVVASLSTARAKSRDAWKKSQLKTMQTALELYFTDNGRYPAGGCDNGSWSRSSDCPTTYITGLSSQMSTLPTGLQTGHSFLYSARASDNYQSYKLMYSLPETETVDGSHPLARCSSSCAAGTWCITTGLSSNPSYYAVAAGTNAACNY